MRKVRAPISTRLRSRDPASQKAQHSPTFAFSSSTSSSAESSPASSPSPPAHRTHLRKYKKRKAEPSTKTLQVSFFSPRSNPCIYLNEINAPPSNIRATELTRAPENIRPRSRTPNYTPFTTTTTVQVPAVQQKRRRRRQRATNAQQATPLRLDEPAPTELTSKEKEKEYWRRQRRVFVRSRCISHQEAASIAQGVYHEEVPTHHRMVISFQANMANFRTKWRKTIRDYVREIGLTQHDDIQSKVDMAMIKAVWGHWLADGYVDHHAFYDDKEAVDVLMAVTAEAVEKCIQVEHGLMDEKQFRQALDRLDQHTRDLALPDSFSQ